MCRKRPSSLGLVWVGCWFLSWARLLPGATFTVTTTADSGAGSLRQALISANLTPGADTIRFNLNGSGIRSIAPQTELPVITDPVTIDGTSQPGFQGLPLVQLVGSNTLNASGFYIRAGNCTVRGLIVSQFHVAGIRLEEHGGNLIAGNYLGSDPAGTPELENGFGIYVGTNCSLNTIGGTDAASPNVIEGNLQCGLLVSAGASDNVIQGNWIGANGNGGVLLSNCVRTTVGGPEPGAGNVISANSAFGLCLRDGAAENQVQGNLIGLNAAGTAALGSQSFGIQLLDSPNNTIGGTEAATRNTISGNSGDGIFIQGARAAGNVIQGNIIGLDPNGVITVANRSRGITVLDVEGVTIGGTEPGAGNVISGNGSAGILCTGKGHVIQGNWIGTDLHGTIARPNVSDAGAAGLFAAGLFAAGSEHTIGGSAAGRNVISGNAGYGVLLQGSNIVVQSNYIGVDKSGTNGLGNERSGVALQMFAANNLIGGTEPGQGNVISANDDAGIVCGDLSNNNLILGNQIGTDATGVTPLSNATDGIRLEDRAHDNGVGAAIPGAGNRIAFNLRSGIVVAGADATGNTIVGNSISDHGLLGISLGRSGDAMPALNDPLDADLGPNRLQNHPIITNIVVVGDLTAVQGTLRTTPDRDYSIDLYHNRVAGASGYGEGEVYLGSVQVTTDAQGEAGFAFIANGLFPRRFFTSTATDSDSGDTSEFGPAFVNSPEPPGVSINDITAAVGQGSGAVAAFSVVLTSPTFRTVTVEFSTESGTASAEIDFVATNGVLTIPPGEKTGWIPIALLPNPTPQPDKFFFVNLAREANAVLADARGQATLVHLFITSLLRAEGTVEVRFSTSAGRSYDLERSGALGARADWRPVAGAVNLPGTGGFLTATDLSPAGTGFYRVRQVKP